MHKDFKRNLFSVYGIKTNNLKNINIQIKLNSITAITGISGGGKSSLAYGTIFEICRQHFNQLEQGSYDYSTYRVDEFYGAVPAIALTQHNFNSNPKSTIYSYLDIPSYLYSITPDGDAKLDHEILRINKPGNECQSCMGTREVLKLNEDLVIDNNKTIEKNPFKCWSGANLAKHSALLKSFCNQEGIDLDKKFDELDLYQKHKLLNSKSKNKFKISFVFSGKRRSREEHYVGPLLMLEEFEKSKNISEYSIFKKFTSPSICSHCNGTGVRVEKYKESNICQISLLDFLRLPVSELSKLLKSRETKSPAALQSLIAQLDTLDELGIGYLSLLRQIPSLSGGELQKLRFSQICNTPMSGVLFVLDEISAQISGDSHKLLISKMRSICDKGNTIVIIEHNHQYIESADDIICVGPSAGEEGGYIVPYQRHAIHANIRRNKYKSKDLLLLPSVSKNNIHKLSAKIPQNAITGICGVSGSGKSSFASAIGDLLPNVNYVSQKQMRGNVRSTLATALDLTKIIASIYSKNTGVQEDVFLPQPGKAGCCVECGGTGLIDFTRTFEKTIKVTCPECNGEMFSNAVDVFEVSGLSVKKLYSTPLKSLPEKIIKQSKKLVAVASIADALGVSHLSINRKIGSLSGGESRRIKLLQSLISPNKEKVLIIDEPGAGLDPLSSRKAIDHISEYSNLFKAILIIDHKIEILSRCDYILEFGPGAGPKGGNLIYAGPPQEKHLL